MSLKIYSKCFLPIDQGAAANATAGVESAVPEAAGVVEETTSDISMETSAPGV